VVEKRSLLPNFVPFGVGQFVQGRTEWGVVFALSEAILAVASVVGFWVAESMYQSKVISIPGVLYGADTDGVYRLSVREIAPEKLSQFRAWSAMKMGTGIAFYAVAVAGIVEALVHHRGTSITIENQKLTLQPMLLPNGAGMGVSYEF
jgi:hypothetical protein